MAKILVIPTGVGESFICNSITDVMNKLGISADKISMAIKRGISVISDNRDYFLDYALDFIELTKECLHKYELISMHDNSVHKFNSYDEIANFCNRSYDFVHNRRADGSIIESLCGTYYKLKVIT